MRQAIRRIAKVDALARTGASWVSPIPSIPGAEYLETVYGLVWTRGPSEILEHNREQLAAMDFEEALIEELMRVEWLTPTIQTSLVALVEELPEVEGRPEALAQALTVRSDADAFFFVESLVLAVWYHTNREPLGPLRRRQRRSGGPHPWVARWWPSPATTTSAGAKRSRATRSPLPSTTLTIPIAASW